MAAIGDTAVCGLHRDGVIRAEEHLNGPLCAAEVDLEALSIGECFYYRVSNCELTRDTK